MVLTQYFNIKKISLLPIVLYLFGIALLPFGTNESFKWKALVIDISIHALFVILSNILLNWRIKHYPTKVLAKAHATLLAFFVAIVLFLLADLLLCSLLINDNSYLVHLDQTQSMRYILSWMCLGWIAHITVLRKWQAENQKEYELHQKSLIHLRDAELFKLRQQLQPHFLYNSLNSINALIQLDPDNAQVMVGKLSDFLRLSVKRELDEYLDINEELEYIESYLSIESVRFGNRLKVNIEKAAPFNTQAKVPAFMLQPIIENAIKFGLYGNTGEVQININIETTAKLLNVSIENPFDPLSQTQKQKGTGFGLEAIARRLSILYRRNDLLETQKIENIFITRLKIPQ